MDGLPQVAIALVHPVFSNANIFSAIYAIPLEYRELCRGEYKVPRREKVPLEVEKVICEVGKVSIRLGLCRTDSLRQP